MKKTHLF